VSAEEALLEYINDLWIVDTHEHLPTESARPQKADVLSEWLTHYFSSDLVSAGLPDADLERARDSSKDLMGRWRLVEPYWNAARSTGYGRSLDLSAQGIYGIDGVRGDTIQALNEAFVTAREKGAHYRHVLKDKGRIALSITDANPECDAEFFASTVRMDQFIAPPNPGDLVSAARAVDVRIHDLRDVKAALELALDKAFANEKVVTLKCGLAYSRTLRFDKVSEAKAEEDFNRFLFGSNVPGSQRNPAVGRDYQDHMMHHLLKLADERGLPFQFHTGLQEGNGNVIANANPVHLTNLFLEYGNVKFDVFHMGYPYVMELSNLAKNFRNVFIDMCWGNIISPEAARRALVEWLDAVPANKISAFGGDYCFVDGVYGHQKIARQNVAAALAQKVADGSFDVERGREIAHWLFVDNPARIFGLEGRL